MSAGIYQRLNGLSKCRISSAGAKHITGFTGMDMIGELYSSLSTGAEHSCKAQNRLRWIKSNGALYCGF